MDKRLKKVAIGSGIFAVIVFAIAGFFVWRSAAYVDTFHARVMGETTIVTVPVSGRLLRCDVETGDTVAAGEELAVIEAYVSSVPGSRVALPVRAPTSGIVVQRPADLAESVTAGQELATLVAPDKLWVEANINEGRIGQVKVGQAVRVRIQPLKLSFRGQVEQVGRATTVSLTADGGRSTLSEAGSAEVPVRISLDTDGYRLLPGMSAEVRIRVDPRAW